MLKNSRGDIAKLLSATAFYLIELLVVVPLLP